MERRIKFLALIALYVVLNQCSSDSKEVKYSNILSRNFQPKQSGIVKRDIPLGDCEDFVVLISASKLAEISNHSREWVKRNYEIPVYADTSSTNPRVIGHAPPGGDCFIIKHEGSWFYVQTPITSELGWINKKFIVGFVKKDPATFIPC